MGEADERLTALRNAVKQTRQGHLMQIDPKILTALLDDLRAAATLSDLEVLARVLPDTIAKSHADAARIKWARDWIEAACETHCPECHVDEEDHRETCSVPRLLDALATGKETEDG